MVVRGRRWFGGDKEEMVVSEEGEEEGEVKE